MPADRPREVKTILVATGLTPDSAGAAAVVLRLQSALGAAVHAAYVVEPVREEAERAVPGLSAAHEKQTRGDFEAAAARGLSSATRHVLRGSPATEVLRLAREIGADLIVVGRHGPGGAKAERLGTIAHRVLLQSPVSVLVVPPEADGQIGRIGVGTDFGEGSDLALRRAAELCRVLGVGELAVLHAFAIPAGHHMIASWQDACKRLRGVSEQLTTEQIARVLGAEAGALRRRIRCEEGDDAAVVARLAGEEKLDLLVLSAHSRTRAAAALLGHTSERIIRYASCAVWAEKAPGLAQGFLEAVRELLK